MKLSKDSFSESLSSGGGCFGQLPAYAVPEAFLEVTSGQKIF